MLASFGSCSSSDGADGQEEAPAVQARIERSRLFELERQLKLVVEVEDDEVLELTSQQLDSP
ncbi:hypothetical protein B7486_67695, partial [cyanobacterium TDX16]